MTRRLCESENCVESVICSVDKIGIKHTTQLGAGSQMLAFV